MRSRTRIICTLLAFGLICGPVHSTPTITTSFVQKAPGLCVERKTAAPFGYWMWRAGARVRVYVRASDFGEKEFAAVLGAIKLWDGAGAETGAGVTFEYVGEADDTKTEDNSLTIMRGATNGKDQRGEIRAVSRRGDQVIDYASITIDTSVTGAAAVANALAHEIGHSLGLLDCYSCSQASTAMFKLGASGVKGPTACDTEQVGAAYRQLKLFIRPAPTESQQAADEGEEPVEDDTPVVEPGSGR